MIRPSASAIVTFQCGGEADAAGEAAGVAFGHRLRSAQFFQHFADQTGAVAVGAGLCGEALRGAAAALDGGGGDQGCRGVWRTQSAAGVHHGSVRGHDWEPADVAVGGHGRGAFDDQLAGACRAARHQYMDLRAGAGGQAVAAAGLGAGQDGAWACAQQGRGDLLVARWRAVVQQHHAWVHALPRPARLAAPPGVRDPQRAQRGGTDDSEVAAFAQVFDEHAVSVTSTTDSF